MTRVNDILGMLVEWTKREPEKKKLIEEAGGILAIDAISLGPRIVVKEYGVFEGILESEVINESEIAEF